MSQRYYNRHNEAPTDVWPMPGQPGYSHEVHLPERRAGVVDKVNTATFDPADYIDSLADAARSKADRFRHQATAMAPFAEQPDARRFPQDTHRAPRSKEIPDKVNEAVADAQAYLDSLEQIAKGREDRFNQAAGAAAPYAMAHDAGAGAELVDRRDYVPITRNREIVGKINSQEYDTALYQHSLEARECGRMDRFNRAAAAEPPFAVQAGASYADRWGSTDFHAKRRHHQEVVGKVNVEAFDASLCSSNRLANQQDMAQTRARNHGVPGLLQDSCDGCGQDRYQHGGSR